MLVGFTTVFKLPTIDILPLCFQYEQTPPNTQLEILLLSFIEYPLCLRNLVESQFSSVQSLSRVRLFAISWTAACQASLSITNSWNLPKPMSIESVMSPNHVILCHPLLLLPSIFPSIRVFSNESALRIR